jgi:protein phosphatase
LELQGDERFAGMGTTAVALRYRQLTSFFGTGIRLTAEVAHVGDSRAYLLRDGRVVQVTEDHSLVAELVKNGSITRAQAANHPHRNVLTRALGDGEAWADSVLFEVRVGDRMLLCSDGLSDVVPEEDIARVLRSSARDPEVAARELVEAALEAGGPDNVSVVVVDVRAFVPAYRHQNGAAQRAVYLSAEPGESESIANPEKTRTLRRARAERTRIPSVSVRGRGLISAGEETRPGVGG